MRGTRERPIHEQAGWIRLRTKILIALADYPEARASLEAALEDR
jgi:hypothetical protein